MAIVNLSKRLTTDFEDYGQYIKSSDSFIYEADKYPTDESGPDCLTLTVGNCWYDQVRYIEIDPKRGIKVRPHTGVVIETNEEIALPLNIYGLIFGAGSNIYKGIFISGGKIDPGFNGKLRIGYYNTSNESINLKTGDKLGYAIFLSSESDQGTRSKRLGVQAPVLPALKWNKRLSRWLKRNFYQIITSCIAIASLIVAIFK